MFSVVIVLSLDACCFFIAKATCNPIFSNKTTIIPNNAQMIHAHVGQNTSKLFLVYISNAVENISSKINEKTLIEFTSSLKFFFFLEPIFLTIRNTNPNATNIPPDQNITAFEMLIWYIPNEAANIMIEPNRMKRKPDNSIELPTRDPCFFLNMFANFIFIPQL
ncbi:MAG: hypothetical protein DRP42_02375 [Tenericutes bacterium]|nr:MAG: hypothetical protein DRP42_02375 [Mycoplasmatota bacterium]